MGNPQKLKFRDVEDFLEYLPEQERKLVNRLRALEQSCLPDAEEQLSYNVPYYSRHSRICFIWPASVPWGKVPTQRVVLGFCQGALLPDETGYLEKGNRTQVSTKTFAHLADIEEEVLKAFLYEALAVDDKQQALKQAKLKQQKRC